MKSICRMYGCVGVFLAATTLFSADARAEMGKAEQKGTAIAVELDRRDEGFGDSRANVEMILKDRGGQQSVRELRVMTLEVIDRENGDRTLVQFDRPRDIAGTTLLSFSRFAGDDDQWLFLPALRRVKRISSGNKSGPFVGSEFAYEDILSQEHQRYRHRWLRDEPYGGHTCFVVERRPTDRDSGYSRQIVWIDSKEYRPLRIEYYDRRNALLKSLVYKDYRQYRDRFWRAHEMVMQNRQTGKSTVLRVSGYEFGVGLTESHFHPGRLRTMR
jgi:outer membrane lipoprotein-sorting protein